MTLTVACLWVEGPRKYGREYVEKLYSMVARHIGRPFEFVCLTDRPEKFKLLPHIRPIKVRARPGLAAWWLKPRHLFDPQMPLGERIIYFDIDTLIVGDLGPMIDFPAPFAVLPTSVRPDFVDRKRPDLKVIHRFQTSVMVWNKGAMSELSSEWSMQVTAAYRSDQDWLGDRFPDAPTFPDHWALRSNFCGPPPWPETRVILMNKPKTKEAAETVPWVKALWR